MVHGAPARRGRGERREGGDDRGQLARVVEVDVDVEVEVGVGEDVVVGWAVGAVLVETTGALGAGVATGVVVVVGAGVVEAGAPTSAAAVS